MKTLYLIDGYGQFFRSYHAIRTPMTSPVTKEPTNMSFGFWGMMLKLMRGEGKLGGKPDYVIVTLDVSGDRETFRSELYPEYKATRSEPPADLFPQVDRCVEMLREIGVPVIGVAGYEADDVIASIVSWARREHPELRIRIVSKDKDFKQLLVPATGEGSPGVELFDIQTDTVIDAAALKAETGLDPAHVVDMLALMGDSVDNVPGVKGVGEKTAAELVREFGSVEEVIARADQIKGKRGENVRAAAAILPLSKTLVKLRSDVPLEVDLERARGGGFALDRLVPRFKELGFNRYQDEVRALTGVGAAAEEKAAAVRTATAAPTRSGIADMFQGGLFEQVAAAEHAESTKAMTAWGDYRCVRTREELEAVVARLRAAPVVAFDTETTSLSPHDCLLCGISVAVEPGEAWYIPVRSPSPGEHLDERTVLDALGPVLEDAGKPKCGHNLKFDLLVLRSCGVTLRGLWRSDGELACDSMVASYLIDASRSSHGLDALALALLNHQNISIKDLIGSGAGGTPQRTFDTVPVDLATAYAAEDADVALRLRETMLPQIRAMGMVELMRDVETPLVEVLAELEWNGVLVDPAELDRQRDRLGARIAELRREIDREALGSSMGRTFNPDSPKQLAAALFNAADDAREGVEGGPGLGLKPIKRTKTGYSTDTEVLEELSQAPEVTTRIPGLILEYRQLSKLVSTYLVALKEAIHPKTGRIHASFNQTVAATGRLSSSDPNLQNIPIRTDIGREIRKAFIAPPGRVLVTADYSQIELRLLAHLSRDPALIAAFERGEDIHAAVAAQIHGVRAEDVTREQRSGAKMVNFGIVYGITSFGLARRLGIGERQAAEIIDGYKKRFAGITTFLQECIEQARSLGHVETMLKRRRPIPDIHERNPSRRAFAERTAINSVVQGSAADLIKLAMIELYRIFSDRMGEPEVKGVKLLLQIHDELVLECDEGDAQRVRDRVVGVMEGAMRLGVPLKADAHVAKNWYEGK